MSVVGQNKWYVEPVPDEETDAWLLTYLDLITLLLVLLVVMLALSGQAAKQSPASDVLQVIPTSADDYPLPAAVANTEWDPPTYAPNLADLGFQQATLFVDLPSHFQAQTDPDVVLRHVMGQEVSAPAPVAIASALVAPEPVDDDVGLMALLDLPELGDDIEVIRNRESISFRINSEILYSSAKVDLSREGIAVLRKLLPVFKGSEYTITVEGHTDALPIRGGPYPSNWELSSARAGRVVRYLAANGVGRTRLRAIGYADTRALASNNTEQGRTSNRRVEIILEQPESFDTP